MEQQKEQQPPDGAAVEQDVVEVGLKRPRFWSVHFAVLFSLLLVAAVTYYVTAVPRLADLGAGLAEYIPHLLVPAALCALALGVRLWLRPRRVVSLTFYGGHALLPRSPDSGRVVLVPYDDIRSVDLRGQGPAARLLVGTSRRLFVYTRAAFASPNGIEQALRELYQHILRLPQGSSIVERIARNRRQAAAVMGNPTVATQALLALCTAYFVLEFFGGAFESPLGALRFGAVSPALLKAGDAYRLFSSALLHANVLHLYLDALALFFLGSMLERLLGRTRFLLVYLISALAGALVSALAGHNLFTVSASTGVFGMLGGIAVVTRRFRGELPLGFAQPLRWWLVFLLAIGALSLVMPEIDLLGHLGAFAVGVLVTLLVIEPQVSFDLRSPASQALRYTASALAALFVLSAGAALARALDRDSRVEARAARTVLDDAQASPVVLNELAWRVAVSRAAQPELLALALQAAERAATAAPEEMAIADTLAAVQYRLGRHDEAVALERRVLARTSASFAAEHLAAFLRARTALSGPLQLGQRAATARLAATTPAAPKAGVPPRMVATLGADLPHGVTFLALGTRGERVVALVQGTLGPSQAGEHVPAVGGGQPWPRDAQYALALVEARCADCDSVPPGLRVWNLEAALHDLP